MKDLKELTKDLKQRYHNIAHHAILISLHIRKWLISIISLCRHTVLWARELGPGYRLRLHVHVSTSLEDSFSRVCATGSDRWRWYIIYYWNSRRGIGPIFWWFLFWDYLGLLLLSFCIPQEKQNRRDELWEQTEEANRQREGTRECCVLSSYILAIDSLCYLLSCL